LFKTNFSGNNKIWGHKKFGGMPPVATGLVPDTGYSRFVAIRLRSWDSCRSCDSRLA